MKKHLGVITLALTVVLILLLYAVMFSVRYQEQALVLRWGKINRVEAEPGLKWQWPYPIEKVVKLDCRIRTYQPVAYELQTRDRTTLIVGLYVNWRIKDPVVFYNRFPHSGAGDQAEVVQAAEKAINGWLEAARSVFAERDLSELVTLDEKRFKLATIEHGDDQHEGMLQRVRDQAGQGYGIEIVDLGIRKLGVPDSVSEAVFNRMKEERGAEERRLLAEGQSDADAIVGNAKSRATRIRAEAEAQAKSIEGEGDAEAAQYYASFLKHPQLATFLRQLETLRKTLSQQTTLILDSQSPPYQLLKTGPKVIDQPEQDKKQ